MWSGAAGGCCEDPSPRVLCVRATEGTGGACFSVISPEGGSAPSRLAPSCWFRTMAGPATGVLNAARSAFRISLLEVP